jgi:transcription initiation factor TFIID subunit 5
MPDEATSEKYIERIVFSYLNKKGYKETEAILRKESKAETVGNLEKTLTHLDDNQLAKLIIASDPANQQGYERGYVKLRRWIEDSIDLYKVGLLYSLVVISLVQTNITEHARMNSTLSYTLYLFTFTWS